MLEPFGGCLKLRHYLVAAFYYVCQECCWHWNDFSKPLDFSTENIHKLQPFYHTAIQLFVDEAVEYCERCQGIKWWIWHTETPFRFECCEAIKYLCASKQYSIYIFEGVFTICPLACLCCMYSSIHQAMVHCLCIHLYQDPTCLKHWGLTKYLVEWWLRAQCKDEVRTDIYFQFERCVAKALGTPCLPGAISYKKLIQQFKRKWRIGAAHPSQLDLDCLVENSATIPTHYPWVKSNGYYDSTNNIYIWALSSTYFEDPEADQAARALTAGALNKNIDF
jgi:hypothetical protein